jgi:hypothetical protein
LVARDRVGRDALGGHGIEIDLHARIAARAERLVAHALHRIITGPREQFGRRAVLVNTVVVQPQAQRHRIGSAARLRHLRSGKARPGMGTRISLPVWLA